MLPMVFKAFYYFFLVLEGLLFLYIVSSWFPGTKLRSFFYELLQPLFTPIRFLLKHSVFGSNFADFTPMIALILLSYLQSLFYQLSSY